MLKFAGRSHPGRREGPNEDSIGWAPDKRVFLVADGMGGHQRGDLASGVVRDTVLREAGSGPLAQAIMTAHRAVIAAAPSEEVRGQLGSTVVVARLGAASATCEIGWVGDSRCYLWRGGQLRLLTRDHSVVELLREEQQLTDTQVRTHPHRNLVTQTLGMGEPVPATLEQPLETGDWLLLCSDGLHGELRDREIAEVLGRSGSPDQAVEQLVDAALDRGAHDNVSTIVVEYTGPSHGTQVGARRTGPVALAAVAGIIGALVAVAIWFWLGQSR
jgi:protein phosphatase